MKYVNKYKFTLLGGDLRLAYLAELLSLRGHAVHTFSPAEDVSFFSGVTVHSDMRDAISAGDILILPIPISKDGIHLNTSGGEQARIPLSDIFLHARKTGIRHILGGHIVDKVHTLAHSHGIKLADYSLDEEFLQKNAEATAEGGIMIAMENSSVTLKSSRALIGGFGRIAKHLCKLLSAFGAEVTVIARRDEILEEIRSFGYNAIRTDEYDKLRAVIRESDVIFNTVPAQIFGERVLEGKSRAVYIELASCPGGINLKAARETGMNIIFAPSLPGRYSPESAGGYILDGIRERLGEEWIYI